MVVGDDIGFGDLGARNGGKTQTPALDALIREGVSLSSYYAFKICSPSRASSMTGRYPWASGFYDMTFDQMHTTSNFTAYPQLLKDAGYATHAIGKWDMGSSRVADTATHRGFDTFFGYYLAVNGDYFYHSASGSSCPTAKYPMNSSITDWSDAAGAAITPERGYNGTYNRQLLSGRAAEIIAAHPAATPLYMYLAFMNGHEAGPGGVGALGLQAPLATVELYNRTVLDTYKLAGAQVTELDLGVAEVVAALKSKGMWDNTVLVFVSDNGGPLDHSVNAPLRGGKHTFWEGGVRVEAFVAGGGLPAARRGTTWDGMAHVSDWYRTLVEGAAGLPIAANATGGPRPLDSLNLWPSLLSGAPSPRREVVLQVVSPYFSENASAIRVDDMKLIVGVVGDNRTVALPVLSPTDVPLGRTGAVVEPGTDHVRSPDISGGVVPARCHPFCLFNLTADLNEGSDLAGDPAYAAVAKALLARLDAEGAAGPPNAWRFEPTHFTRVIGPAMCSAQIARGNVQPFDFVDE